MIRADRPKRLAPFFFALLVAAVFLGALTSVVFAALSSRADLERPRLEPYPKLTEKQVGQISTLFDPSLPFNENVVADAFQDRAGLANTPAARAALAAPVVQAGTAARVVPPSGYGHQGATLPTAQARPTPDPVDETERRRAAARRSGKFGRPDEASIYAWREVLPLGLAGLDKGEGGPEGKVRDVDVMFKSTLTGRVFAARKNAAFADATLAEVTGGGVVFRDAAGTHEVGWSRSRARSDSRPAVTTGPPPRPSSAAPSGYAEGANSTAARRQP